MVPPVRTIGLEFESELAIEPAHAEDRTRLQVGVIVAHGEDPGATGAGDGGLPCKMHGVTSIGRLEAHIEIEGEIAGGVVSRVGAQRVVWQGRLP